MRWGYGGLCNWTNAIIEEEGWGSQVWAADNEEQFFFSASYVKDYPSTALQHSTKDLTKYHNHTLEPPSLTNKKETSFI